MREHAPIGRVSAAILVVTLLGLGANTGAAPRGYFGCPVLVFFAPCPTIDDAPSEATTDPGPPLLSPAAPTDGGHLPIESLWAEPRSAIETDGPTYVPPKPVREFLEAPTPEGARAYLAWNQGRLRAIAQATAVLRLVTEPEMTAPRQNPTPTGSPPTAGCATPAKTVEPATPTPGSREPLAGMLAAVANPAPAPHGVTVLYAFASWCPYSARQTPLVAAWARSRPDVPVTGLLFDSPSGAAAELDSQPLPVRTGSRALRERLGVQSYPTLLVFKNGVLVERLAGLVPMARLEATIRALGA